MDPRERMNDKRASLLAMLDGRQAHIYTALPGVIESYDQTEMTCSVQPAIQGRLQNPDGSFVWEDLPLLIHCPVVFPQGGGFTLTFPVAAGDECLVVFSQRCIDAWWQSGAVDGPQPQAELRMHDISDGFALMGVRSVPRVIANLSNTATQLRSDDGGTYVEVAAAKVTLTPDNHATYLELTPGQIKMVGTVIKEN